MATDSGETATDPVRNDVALVARALWDWPGRKAHCSWSDLSDRSREPYYDLAAFLVDTVLTVPRSGSREHDGSLCHDTKARTFFHGDGPCPSQPSGRPTNE